MMKRLLSPIVVFMVALAGCGGEEKSASPPATTAAPPATTTEPADTTGEFGSPTKISGRANIFGAGRDRPPAPGHGGAGVLPPAWQLPASGKRIVTFASTSGRVNPVSNFDEWNGPEGAGDGVTDITSYDGISGIVDHGNTMFLVGVFLTDAPPAGKAPRRLDFTKREDFEELAPKVGQTFFIGDGQNRRYRVPELATRLFVGFADAFGFGGEPGWYGNNAGDATVIAEVSAT